jgi:hypothetical protein
MNGILFDLEHHFEKAVKPNRTFPTYFFILFYPQDTSVHLDFGIYI